MAKGTSFIDSIDHETLPNLDGKPSKARGIHQERGGKVRRNKDKELDTTYDKPDPKELAVDTAHAAHRQVLSDWVRGDASDAKMRKSHRRLHAAIKAHR